MISKLILRNFQRWKKAEFDLGPITTIVGPTDSGKSAIVRALRLVLLNQPQGDFFIRHGASKCSVAIEVDGRVVKRKRGGTNSYLMDDQVFKAFGTSVPETISKFLNVSKLNFQGQFDPNFWISLTTAEAGKQLNSIVDMELIDRVLNKVVQEERQLKQQAEYESKHLEAIKHTLKQLRRIPAANAAFARVVEVRENLEHLTHQKARLRSAVETLSKLQSAKRTTETGLQGLSAVVSAGQTARRLQQHRKRLQGLLQGLQGLRTVPPELFQRWEALPKPAAGRSRKLSVLIDRLSSLHERVVLCQQKVETAKSQSPKREVSGSPERTLKVRCEQCGNVQIVHFPSQSQ